ncbi:MAG: hypothetical protein DME19_05290 [Verrucomicrobia bacterium]|nr:MAG: hypothetical protein DME19_05290 [Verrucomicrobiota bacterium]
MELKFSLKTRREFLRTTMLGGALTWTVPTFLARTFSALQAQAAGSGNIATGKDAPIVVILQMAGGNDGLNTVVPFANDHYFRARPRLAHKPGAILKLNDQIGLHPGLTGVKSLFDQGHVSIVQGVGYPNPNRSHFRSTEIWQTASDSNKVEKYGWLGRYFDNCCAGADPTVGVNIGRQMPQAFAAKHPTGISLDNPENYRLAGVDPAGGKDPTGQSLREMNRPEMDTDPGADINSGGTIGAVAGKARAAGSVLDYLERTALDAQVSSDRIREITKRVTNQATYPASQLGNGLKLIARLIGGGLPTRIFYVSQGGYDTHTNQAGPQARLLQDLGDSAKAFVDDLKAQGNFERVLLMTFSEFGRRAAENASGGTDHGAAAPMFVVGPKVKAGLLGRYPSLAPEDLFNGDLKYNLDFRSVYSAVLQQWLKTRSEPILGRKFEPLQLV